MARLRNVDRYFVKAQKLAFPYATKTIAGPFEEWRESVEEMIRLQADFPGCTLSYERRRVPIEKSHPK